MVFSIESARKPLGFVAAVSALALIVAFAHHVAGREYLSDGPGRRMAETALSLWDKGHLESETFADIFIRVQTESRITGQLYWQDAFSIGRQGQLFPKHSLLSSVLAAPFYGMFGRVGFLIFNVTAYVLLLFAVYSISKRICRSEIEKLVFIVAGLGTQGILYVYGFSHDLHAATLSLTGLWLLRSAPLWGGVVLMSAIFVRPSSVLLVPFLLFAWWSPRLAPRESVDAVGGCACVLMLFLFINSLMWGDPLATSYSRTPHFSAGRLLFLSHPVGFDLQTLFSDLPEKLFSASRGLILYNPILFTAPWVVWFSLHHPEKRFLLCTLSGAFLYCLYIFSYQMWHATTAGNRFLFPAIYLYLPAAILYLAHSIKACGMTPRRPLLRCSDTFNW